MNKQTCCNTNNLLLFPKYSISYTKYPINGTKQVYLNKFGLSFRYYL